MNHGNSPNIVNGKVSVNRILDCNVFEWEAAGP